MKKITYVLALLVFIALQSCKNESKNEISKSLDDDATIVENQVKKNSVTPPFEGVDVPFSKYTVDVEKGKTIQTETGTVIIIPKGAFKDADGNSVKGKVDITYREFHDAAAIIASGIPMTNSEGDKYMETAGMFEINGSQNGQEIAIADDKAIEVKMGSFVEGENFDFFYFDKKECNWETKGTAKPEPNMAKLTKVKDLPKVPNQPAKPTKFNEDAFVFDLDINYETFPELRAYHGVVWQYDGQGKNNPKVNSWVFQENWASVNVRPVQPEFGKYELILKNSKKTFKTNVTPTLKGMDYDKAIASFKNKNEEYKRLKEARVQEETRLSSEADLLRTFAVNNFGIHNWDIWKRPNRKKCLASFDFGQEADKYINKISVFLVTGANRSVVRYTPSDFSKFSFDPSQSNLLIAVLPGNKVAYFKPEDFKNIDLTMLSEQQTYTFKMTVEADAVVSIGDLESIIARIS
jgi:hypothetical protein